MTKGTEATEQWQALSLLHLSLHSLFVGSLRGLGLETSQGLEIGRLCDRLLRTVA